jgi:hypothetical protein
VVLAREFLDGLLGDPNGDPAAAATAEQATREGG